MTALAPVPELPRRLVYLGTPAMAVPPLEALVAAGFEVLLVVSRPDKRRGRGSDLTPSPVKAAAVRLGILVTDRVEDALEVGAELAVVVAFGQLIKRPVLERLAMVNIHFSLLPRWRGAAPIERALLAGDTETGTCLMRLEEGLDTGPLFDRVAVPIGPTTTAAELRASLVTAGTEQLLRCLTAGLGAPVEQEGDATYAAKIDPAELEIDWNRSAAEIDRLIRVGGAFTTFRGRRFKVHGAALEGAGAGVRLAPGVLAGAVVGTGTEPLRLVRVQPDGKPIMDADSWRNGARPDGCERLGQNP